MSRVQQEIKLEPLTKTYSRVGMVFFEHAVFSMESFEMGATEVDIYTAILRYLVLVYGYTLSKPKQIKS